MTALIAGKACPHCGKTLRVDNKRGACSACLAKPKWGGGKPVARPSPARARVPMLPACRMKAQGDAVTRFKVVANALGFDGDGMLEQYALTWLDAVSTLWSKAMSNPAAPTTKAKLVSAPVRLQSGASAEARPAADTGAGA